MVTNSHHDVFLSVNNKAAIPNIFQWHRCHSSQKQQTIKETNKPNKPQKTKPKPKQKKVAWSNKQGNAQRTSKTQNLYCTLGTFGKKWDNI